MKFEIQSNLCAKITLGTKKSDRCRQLVLSLLTRPVLDRFHDSSKVNALCFMFYALCSMLYVLCFMFYALCSMLYVRCFMFYALCSMLYASYWNNAKNAHAHPQKPVLARPSWPARPHTHPRPPAPARTRPRTPVHAPHARPPRPPTPAHTHARTHARLRPPAQARAFLCTLLCARLKLRKYEKVC